MSHALSKGLYIQEREREREDGRKKRMKGGREGGLLSEGNVICRFWVEF